MIVEFENVDFAYDAEPVLESVDLRIPAGDFASIVGPNGGGKTTMLRLMLGLIDPTRGRVALLGGEPARQRRFVGYTPQYLHVDFGFPVSVRDVVLMGTQRPWRFRYSRADRLAAEEALATVRLAEYGGTPFRNLSGGQRQRVLIARALCGDPKALLLDEPTSNIDPGAEEILFDILRELNKRMTIILVSHDIGFVSQYVKSVVCVNRSVVVHPTTVLNGTLINEIYGRDVRMILHDHRCTEHGHIH